MCAMLLGNIIYASVLNTIGKHVSNYNKLASDFSEKMIYTNLFLKLNNVPQKIILASKAYMQNEFTKLSS